MPIFKFAVTETRNYEMEYTVEAATEAEARDKAEIGDTVAEVEIDLTGVSDRFVAERVDRIIATFHPQAWANDHAIDVDPEGSVEIDVTEHVVSMGREAALAIKDGHDSSDALRTLSTAPDWIFDWSGPFRVEVEDSIRNYFGED